MRGLIEVVWLEDNLKERGHMNRVKSVTSIISNKGYSVNITQVNNLSDAKDLVASPERRVDFFISDYNLGGNETGLDYLLEIRRQDMYKQFFILYSKNEYNEIRSGVIDKLQENNIELFCNFTFLSLSSSNTTMIESDFAKAIDISLSRWDELNAIRGLYMCEHAELELSLREKFGCVDDENKSYKDLFYRLKKATTRTYIKSSGPVYDEWIKLIEYRNLLAHTIEGYDYSKGFYIQSTIDKNIVIYENQLDQYRKGLQILKEKILFLIENPNRPFPREW